jgi:hypothetical protein
MQGAGVRPLAQRAGAGDCRIRRGADRRIATVEAGIEEIAGKLTGDQ